MFDVRFNIGKAITSAPLDGFIPNPKLKLLDQVSEVMRFKHYSLPARQKCSSSNPAVALHCSTLNRIAARVYRACSSVAL